MSDVVGTSLKKEPYGVLEGAKATSTNAQEQEVNDLSAFLKVEHNKYIQNKIIHETLEEYVSEASDVNVSLKNKVADILQSINAAQALTLDDSMLDRSSVSVFGFCDISKPDLNYTERNQLQEILKLKLDQKLKDMSNRFYNSANRDIDVLETQDMNPLEISPEDKVLIDYKGKLVFEQEQCVKILLTLSDILKEITNLRLRNVPQLTEHKIKECKLEEKINHMKSLLTRKKVQIDVFMETSNSLKAYKELIADIKQQQKDCQHEINDLKELKEKYNRVSCKQYDDILKSYLQYKSTIEKKKILYGYFKT